MMRIVSATGQTGGEREGEADPGPGTAVGSIEDREPTAVRLHEPPADEEAQARAGDVRLAHVPRPMERFRDETPFRLGHADTLVIHGHREPRFLHRGADHDGTAIR